VVTNGGRLTVSGSTTSVATNVTVNALSANLYADVSFASTNQSWASGANTFTAIAKDVYGRSSTSQSTVTVIPTNSGYAYDLNGNLLTDGTRNFGYDDENQLIAVWQANAWSNNFVYDGKMRRRIERDYIWNAGTSGWQQTNEIHFIYDGRLVIQERDLNNQPQGTYTRGQDLSGTLQGAGGIGGLLARSDRAQSIPGEVTSGGVSEFGTHSYYHADGNGNVTMLIAASQMIVAKYLYDPFGNTLAKCGLLADVNNYRFSSKEWNGNSGLYYYLYRFYDPNLQRWLNRDPLGDDITFDDLYEFEYNNPLNVVDPNGLSPSLNPQNQIWAGECLETAGQIVTRCKPQPVPRTVPIPITTTCPPPPGDCTQDKLDELTRAKDEACKSVRSCVQGDTPEEIRGKIAQARKCLHARRLRENTCFRGGDQGHRDQMEQLINLMDKCKKDLRNSGE
jgi:RHS repeat-associated protein